MAHYPSLCRRFQEAAHSSDARAFKSELSREADARTRTGDPFITSEVLYQLSYVGSRPTVAGRESNLEADGYESAAQKSSFI
jgi:hypothetical protein